MKGLDANTQKYELAEIDIMLCCLPICGLTGIRFRKGFFAMMSEILITLTEVWHRSSRLCW